MARVAALFAVAAAELPEVMNWGEYKMTFGKVYNGEEEDAARMAIFEENLNEIKEVNSQDLEYRLGVNQFTDLSKEEFAAQMLTRKAPEISDAPTLEVHEWDGSELAASVDWTTKGAVTPVKDQGNCGGCWSFAATGSMEGAKFVSTGQLTSLSEQQFLDCDKQDAGCGGGLEYTGWTFFKNKKEGICTESSYPYKGRNGNCQYSSCTLGVAAGSISGIKHVGKSTNALKSAISQQPIAVGVDAGGSFQSYRSGILSSNCKKQLDHSILAVGYSDGEYWKVKNSWGKTWGESGYIRIKMGSDLCGIYDDASYPSVSAAMEV